MTPAEALAAIEARSKTVKNPCSHGLAGELPEGTLGSVCVHCWRSRARHYAASAATMTATIRGLVREIRHDSVLVDGTCQQCDAGDVNEYGCCLDNDCVCNCNKQHRVAKRLAPLVTAMEGGDGDA